jgi:hypothetical protein
MPGVIDAARADKVLERAASALQPREQCRSRRLEDFKLDRPTGLSLDDRSSLSDGISAHHIVSTDTDQVAAAQLAVDREIEQGTVSKAPFLVEPEADRPNFLLLQRPLRTNLPAHIPCRLRMTVEF